LYENGSQVNSTVNFSFSGYGIPAFSATTNKMMDIGGKTTA
jgi:hypothetical protein